MTRARHIDLFSGIGGFALAAHWAGYQTEVFCEQDEFCQQVLSRHWPAVPIVSDIRDFDGSAYAGADLLTGGFPCQPFSCAGKRQGEADNRFLWPEMLRVIREARPTWIVGENVAGIINMALDGVLSDLENEGYATQAFVIPACGVNAPHRRDRVWIVAHAEHDGLTSAPRSGEAARMEQQSRRAQKSNGVKQSPRGDSRQPLQDAMANPNRHEQHRRASDVQVGWVGSKSQVTDYDDPTGNERQSQPRLGERDDGLPVRLAGYWDGDWDRGIPRVATGIPQRAAKLKAMGNAIVPQVAYEIISRIPHD